jgi:GTPase SAR1 family protein
LKIDYNIPYDIPYLETSAKTGENVDESFKHLAQNIRLFLTKSR